MKRVIILRGLPGSGKSTLTREISRIRCGDCLIFNARLQLYDTHPAKAGWAHSECFKMFVLSAVAGNPVLIVDNTNTTAIQIAPYANVAEAFGYEVHIVEIGCSIVDSITWNIHRVPEDVICRMAMNVSRGVPEDWKNRFVFHHVVWNDLDNLADFLACGGEDESNR